MADLIEQHRGRIVDSPGDNVLAEFASVVDAVQCAVSIQKEIQSRNAELSIDRRMEFRIGINLGDVIEEGERIYGDGVNIAARLETLADPGGICISKTAFDLIESRLPLGYEDIGEQRVKKNWELSHIALHVRDLDEIAAYYESIGIGIHLPIKPGPPPPLLSILGSGDVSAGGYV